MYSTEFEQGWFVNQLTLAARSIGFSDEDTIIWYNTMTGLFSYRCAPPTAVGNQAPQLQSICVAPSCPLAENANCSAYTDKLVPPAIANATLAGNYTKANNVSISTTSTTTTTSTSTTASSSAPAATFSGEAGSNMANIAELVGALCLAFAL